MSESTLPPTTPTSPEPLEPSPRKKRRWPKILLALVALLIVLVALLPTIISLGPVRAIVLSQAQSYINGKIEVASWSFGWLSGTKIDGVKVFDKQGTLVAEADRIDTGLSLLSLIRQNFDLGQVVIDVNATKLVVHKNGQINYLDLIPPAKPTEHAEAKPKTEKAAGPISVPNVKGDIELHLRGSMQLVDDDTGKSVDVQLRQGSGGTIIIADINQGIAPDLKLLYDVNGKSPSEVSIAGTVDAVDNNQLDTAKLLQTLTAKLKLALKDVDLGAAQPVLAIGGVADTTIGGLANGTIDLDLQPGQDGGVKGELAIANFAYAGPQLADAYKADSIRLPISITRSVKAGAVRDVIDVKAIVPETTIVIAGDVPENAIANLLQQKAPGDTGWLSISTTVDNAKVAAAFPKTLPMLPGVKITGGQLVNKVDIAITPAALVTKTQTDFALQGAQNGTPKSIQPINLVIDATLTLPATPSKLSLILTSDFAHFNGGGDSLSQLNGQYTASLDKLHTQLAQFFELGDMKLAGESSGSLKSTTAGNEVSIEGIANFSNLLIGLPGKPVIDFPFVKGFAGATATLNGNSVVSISKANATLLAGADPQKPLLDGQLSAANIDVASTKIGSFAVDHFTISDAAELQRRFVNPFVPALTIQKIVVESGQVYFSTAGSADLSNKTFDLKQCEASLPNLKITKDGQPVLDDAFKFKALAKATTTNGVTHVDVSALSLDSALLTLAKTKDAFAIDLGADQISGGGKIAVHADGPRLNQAVRAFSPQAPAVKSALFDGTLALNGGGAKDSTCRFDGTIKSLTIDQTPINNDSIGITVAAAVPAVMDRATVNASINAAYFDVVAKDVRVQKPAAGEAFTAAVPSANVTVDVSDLAKVQAIGSAFGVALPVNATGSLNLVAAVKSGSVTVDFKGNRLVLNNAKGQVFTFNPAKPITFSLAADIVGKSAIDSITVSKLAGDFDVVTLAMPQAFSITNLQTTPTPQGQIEMAGAIEKIAPLLQVIQSADAPLPYKGAFKFRQSVATQGNDIALKGDGTIDNFEAVGADGQSQFTEKQITITNDLSANPKTHHAAINTLAIDMTSSQAARVQLVGSVANWDTSRDIEGNGLVATVKYDAAKLWPIIYAKLSADQQKSFADAKVVGAFEKKFTITGKYPAAKTMGESIKPLHADGAIELTQFTGGGFDLQQLLLNVLLNKGVATLNQKPAKLNDGTLSLDNVQVDLTQTDLRLFTPKNLQLINKASINPALGNTVGKYVNPTFANAKQAKGLLSVTINECKGVALGAAMQTENSGTATVTINIEDMDIANPLGSLLLGPIVDKLGSGMSSDVDTFQGELKDGKVTLNKGVVTNNLVMTLSKPVQVTDPTSGKTVTVPKGMPLGFAGDTRLRDLEMNMKVSIPAAMIASIAGMQEKKLTDILPDGLVLPLKGLATSPKVDFGGVLGKIGEGLLKSKLTGDSGDGKSPLDNLLKGLDKKKKKKDSGE